MSTLMNPKPDEIIDEQLKRLESYYPKFNADVEENILLKELHLGCTLLKKMVEEKSSSALHEGMESGSEISPEDEDRLEALRIRMDTLDSDLEAIETDLTAIKDNIPIYKEEIEGLKSVDSGFETDIENLISVNESLLKEIETETSRIDTKLGELKAEDQRFNTELDTYFAGVDEEITSMHSTLDSVDTDQITSDITALKEEDIVIQGIIDNNHTETKARITEVDGKIDEVDVTEHLSDIVSLKEEDIEIANKTSTLDIESTEKLDGIEAADGVIRIDLDNAKDSSVGIENKVLIGSITPAAGKVPLGNAEGKLDPDWFTGNEAV